MIETHVFNALLLPAIKEETIFKVLTFVNGLVAPSFLFCAGFAFAIAIRRKWVEYTTLQRSFWRYIIRLLFILVVGYSLHLPFFSLKKLMNLSDPSSWLPFYQVDILQTIAVTLLLLTLSAVCLRKEKIFLSVSMALTLFLVFAAPVIRELDYTNVPVWLSPYFTMQVKSQFPLFPWAAFLISGMLVGAWYIRSNVTGDGRRIMSRLAILSFCGIVVALVAEFLPFTVYPNHNFWRASPEFFIVRLGIVVLLMAGLWWREQRKEGASRSVLSLFGQESLLVYVVHLLVVYGYTYEFSFVRMYGPTLNYWQCFGLFAALTIGMYIMAYVWHWLKGWNKSVASYLQYAVIAGILVAFVVK
jgi:uncharacterized membrane protein